jgi:iron complex outermembrane receptor protein
MVTIIPQIYIRGIGSSNVNNGSDPDVTTQLDGVYIARPFAQLMDFIDVDRIEVLRGPQGTLYGRNAVGGTFNIISRKPSDRLEGQFALTGGNYGLKQVQAYVSGAISPGMLQASLSGNYLSHSGYVQNIAPGGQSLGTADRSGLRAQVRFTPIKSIEAITRIDWAKSNERPDSFDHTLAPLNGANLANSIIGDYRRAAIDAPQEAHSEFSGVAQEVNVTLSETLALKSLTAYRRSQFNQTLDSDFTELPLVNGAQSDKSRQFSQEFDLNVSLPNFKGVTGLYFFKEVQDSVVAANAPPSVNTPAAASFASTATPRAQTRSWAAFAQGTYRFMEQGGLTLGLRYTKDHKQLDSSIARASLNPLTPGVSFAGFPAVTHTDQDWSALTPKIGVDWQFTPNLMSYVSATRGFKSGGTNYATTDPQSLSFAPEKLWAYEAGVKSDWLDRRLRVNLTGFIYDYTDLQVQSGIRPGVIAINNAATAKVKGMELETSARPYPGLLLTANYAFLDAKYGHFPAAAVGGGLIPYVSSSPRYNPTTRTYDASGNQMTAAPRNTFSASAQYDHPIEAGNLFVRGEYYRRSKTSYDPTNAPIIFEPGYSVVNLAFGFSGDKWGMQLLLKNVRDTKYLIQRSGAGSIPGGLAGPPRTIAAQISYQI